MTPLRAAAVGTVTVALVLYTVGTFKLQRSRRSTAGVRGFLSAGLTFDVVATALMIAATGGVAPTLHGWLGYSALVLMAVDVTLVWRHWNRRQHAPLPASHERYARLAYGYWMIAYFAGAALVMAQRRGPS